MTGAAAASAHVDSPEQLPDAILSLELPVVRSTLIVAGGAEAMSDEETERDEPVFAEVLAPLAEEMGAAVVDGGTDSGVMRLMGRARASIGGTFPLIGVVPALLAVDLEPNHTHFLLVPGSRWGDEVPWVVRLAQALSGAHAAQVIVNGGDIARLDAAASVDADYPVFALVGSGRAADDLAAAGLARAVWLDDHAALRAALTRSLDGSR